MLASGSGTWLGESARTIDLVCDHTELFHKGENYTMNIPKREDGETLNDYRMRVADVVLGAAPKTVSEIQAEARDRETSAKQRLADDYVNRNNPDYEKPETIEKFAEDKQVTRKKAPAKINLVVVQDTDQALLKTAARIVDEIGSERAGDLAVGLYEKAKQEIEDQDYINPASSMTRALLDM